MSEVWYFAVLGQSNAGAMFNKLDDNTSGIDAFKASLTAATGQTNIVVDNFAKGGSIVDGNTTSDPSLAWWYPTSDQPGQLAQNAIAGMQQTIAALSATYTTVKVAIIWGQGEADAKRIANGTSTVDRYIEATTSVFEYVRDSTAANLNVYLMETGATTDPSAQQGHAIVREAQRTMATNSDWIDLAAVTSDLPLRDSVHLNDDAYETAGQRLAEFVAYDRNYTTTLTAPRPDPDPDTGASGHGDPPVWSGTPSTGTPNLTKRGTDGNDLLEGGAGNDTLKGLLGDDDLRGLDGNDYIEGNDGNDVITGGKGADNLKGGNGSDTFRFTGLADAGDTILDFRTGTDKIDVSALLPALSGPDPVATAFEQGYLRLVDTGTDVVLQVDVDGSAGPGAAVDLAILLGVEPAAVRSSVFIVSSSGSGGGGGGDTTPPVFQSAEVTGNTLTLTYSEALDASKPPAAGSFVVNVGGVSVQVSSVSVNGANKSVTLVLASAVQSGQTVTLAYNDPSSGNDNKAVQDAAGNDAASFSPVTVTNKTPAGGGSSDLGNLSGGTGTAPLNRSGTIGDDRLEGALANDTLKGLEGNDLLIGGGAADTLWGNAGNDTLVGGVGNDWMKAGDGADTFLFGASHGHDIVSDIRAVDKLRFHDGLFANADEVRQGLTVSGANVVLTTSGGTVVFENTTLSVVQNLEMIFI